MPKIFNSTEQIPHDKTNSKHILFHISKSISILDELNSMLLLACKIHDENPEISLTFWIETVISKETIKNEIKKNKQTPENIVWIYGKSLNPETLVYISLIFTTLETHFDYIFPNKKVVTFQHTSLSIPANLSKPQSPESGLCSYLLQTLLSKVSYMFISSSYYLNTYIDDWKKIAGIFPDTNKNNTDKIFIDYGYMRRESYQYNKTTTPEKIILFTPTLAQKKTKLDISKIIQLLCTKFPDYTIWFRPFPRDRESENTKSIITKSKKFKNFKSTEYIQKCKLKELYKFPLILITDLSGCATSFTMSTERPSIQFITPEITSNYYEFLGCIPSYSEEELCQNIKKCISNHKKYGHKQLTELTNFFRPVGETINYISKNIDKMITGKSLPDSYNITTINNSKFTTYNEYFSIIKEMLKNDVTYDGKDPAIIDDCGQSCNQCENILKLLEFYIIKNSPEKHNYELLLTQIENTMLYYFEYLKTIKVPVHRYIPLDRYLQLIHKSLPDDFSTAKTITILDKKLRTILKAATKKEHDIQGYFFNYCTTIIKQNPKNSIPAEWFTLYLNSKLVNWMKTDHRFIKKYNTYKNKNNDMLNT